MKLTVSGKPVTVTAKDAIGKGGEADVYDLGNGEALKVFKGPKDADYANDPNAQEGARRRLLEQQQKLPAFPSGLPPNVVSPRNLATNGTGRIAGYTMDYLKGCEVLLRYSDRRFREQGGIDPNVVVAIFENLADVLEQLHRDHVVVGDFNDLNVLVDARPDLASAASAKTYLIDADSFQYGAFDCHTFTPRFLDPLISATGKLEMVHRPEMMTDWYAFAVMLFQSLLYVGPYGGVHRPKDGTRPLQHDARVLRRVTVFDPHVIYPRPAIPYGHLPDEVLDYFHQTFEKDGRGAPGSGLIAAIEWTTCANCGTVHARQACPACATYVRREPVVVRGNVKAQRVFWTEGTIVAAAFQTKLRYLYHDGRGFYRENGDTAGRGRLDPALRYRIYGNATIVGRRDKMIVFPEQATTDVDSYGHLPAFDANSTVQYWINPEGQLRSIRHGETFSDFIGDVLPGRTLFWVGEHFGFGFYRAGDLMRAFVFTEKGMNDQVQIPGFRGELVDSTCVFSDQRAWFFATLQENGKLRNHVYVLAPDGDLLSKKTSEQTQQDWLAGGIRGRFAAGKSLFVPTDDGIVRIDAELGGVPEQANSFPDTEPFVDSASYLLAGSGGIHVVKSNEITLVTIG